VTGAAPSGVEVAIVADDLTGAADCAAAFAETGRRPIVLLQAGAGMGEARSGCDVTALSANSRDIDADGAADAVAAAVQDLAVDAPRVWFKKIDSTLRGHLATELRVVADFVSPELTIVCPSFPRTGRVLREGRVFVHGEPLEQTVLWRDAGGREAHLPTMLAAGGTLAVVPVTVAELRSGRFAAILSAAARGRVLVVDAETDDDLDALIRAGIGCGRKVLWVGSAGLSGALAAALEPSAGPVGDGGEAVGSDTGPVLVVAGSASEQTRRQLADLERTCDAAVAMVPVDGLLDRDSGARRATLEHAVAALDARRDAALAIEPAASGARLPRYGTELTDRLGELVGELAGRFDGLVLTGGDTARAVLQALGVGGLAVVGNVEFGIPASHAALGNLRVVTKAGAFGDDHSLSRAVRVLHAWPAEFMTETRGR
jgi:D-threonate/D-erythronate kinase